MGEALVEAVQRRGVLGTVTSSIRTSRPWMEERQWQQERPADLLAAQGR